MNGPKKKLAVVNVFFPPQAVGGASRIVADQVSLMTQHYNDLFELVVFTSDAYRQPAHEMHVYPYNGIRVYSASSLWRVNMDWYTADPKMEELFEKFLDLEQPDILHFHCIQRLTASIVDAARKRNIPYYVTAHDAWWISDYQFLTDAAGMVYPNGHPDPFAKYPLPEGVSLQQSLERKSYLKALLAEAEEVLCVSETYTRLYWDHGISCRTNKNGVSDVTGWREKDTSYSTNVVCGHIGGMAKHKGFHLFKDAVMSLTTDHIELLVVDDSKPEHYLNKATWGNTAVTIVGRVAQERIVDLYRRIDVLFAPSICPESFGLVTREAAACNCWLVGSDVGAIGEDITNENGFKITPTLPALQSVLRQIDGNPRKYKGLSRSPKPRYSSDQVAELVSILTTRAHKSISFNNACPQDDLARDADLVKATESR